MMPRINSLIQSVVNDDQIVIERILYIDPCRENVATINVNISHADPVWRLYKDLAIALETYETRFLETDHLSPPNFSESEIASDKFVKAKRRGEIDWQIIEPLVTGENAVKMLFSKERAILIKTRCIELGAEGLERGVSTKSILRKVRRYWQRGLTQHALLPDYMKSGGRGKPRRLGQLKRGAPSRISKAENRPTGVNVSDFWLNTIIKGGNTFYLHRQKKSFKEAYRRTLATFCAKGYEKETGKPILPDPTLGEVFTERQFKYHFQRYLNGDFGRALIRRYGQRKFNLKYRDIKGDSTSQALWPCALYQIDATLADVYLVSLLNRRHIIGRPVLWIVSDVFSHMIVGFCVRLEGEGWLGLKLALENATADKVTYCARYGITINEDMWPACYLPDQLTGDRGPLSSYNADHLAYLLNTHVSNTPPYRPDWKAIVEQVFNQLNVRVFHGLPGAVDPEHERGDKDYRLAAVLTIHDLTEIVISTILYYNNHHRMTSYQLDKDMIADEVQPYPSELYYWGVDNRSGIPRYKDPETIRAALLPEDTATVTEQGIKFGPNVYSCELAEKEGWFLKARNNGRWNVRIAFDPRTTKVIYLRLGDGSPSILCQLKPKSPFENCDWAEVDTYVEHKGLEEARDVQRGIQALSNLDTEVGNIVAKAAQKTQDAISQTPGESNRSRLKNMRVRRKEELERMHLNEVQELYGTITSLDDEGTLNFVEPPEDNNAEYVPIPQPTNVRDIRERMMRDGQEEG